jgi:hypothetical protein
VCGQSLPHGEIIVDAKGQTSVLGVFAAGDATTVPSSDHHYWKMVLRLRWRVRPPDAHPCRLTAA